MSSDVGLTYLCYFRQTTGIYRSMISEWRRQSKSAGLWQYQTYTILDCQIRAMRYKHFFFFLLFLRGYYGLSRGVRLEWRTDWRRNVKKSSVASAASSVALHRLPEADHCEQRIEYRTRNSEASCSVRSLASDCGVHNLLQVSHIKIAWNMVSSEVSIISRINWYLDRSTALCVSVKRNVHQDIWHQESRVNNKNTIPCLHALQQRGCTVN